MIGERHRRRRQRDQGGDNGVLVRTSPGEKPGGIVIAVEPIGDTKVTEILTLLELGLSQVRRGLLLDGGGGEK